MLSQILNDCSAVEVSPSPTHNTPSSSSLYNSVRQIIDLVWSNIPDAPPPNAPPHYLAPGVVSIDVVGHKLLEGDRFQAAKFLKLDHNSL